jgi:hypothetical protein
MTFFSHVMTSLDPLTAFEDDATFRMTMSTKTSLDGAKAPTPWLGYAHASMDATLAF